MPLTKWTDYVTANPDEAQKMLQVAWVAKGTDAEWYLVEVDQATGNLPVSAGTALAAATFEVEGTELGTNLTGAFANVKTLANNCQIIILRNMCDQMVVFSLDGGTTAHYTLDVDESVTLDLGATSRFITAAVQIHCKHAGTVPTSGSVYVNPVG